MKHEQQEWYSCDRCGEEINIIPSAVSFIPFKRYLRIKPNESELIYADNFGYISEEYCSLEKVIGVDIIEQYKRSTKTIHLCGRCRKDFEKFMRNE